MAWLGMLAVIVIVLIWLAHRHSKINSTEDSIDDDRLNILEVIGSSIAGVGGDKAVKDDPAPEVVK